jgi:hypothetical protein
MHTVDAGQNEKAGKRPPSVLFPSSDGRNVQAHSPGSWANAYPLLRFSSASILSLTHPHWTALASAFNEVSGQQTGPWPAVKATSPRCWLLTGFPQ